MSDTKLTIDARQAFAELDNIEKALAALEARFRRLGGVTREGLRSNMSGPFVAGLEQARRNAETLRATLAQVGEKNRLAFNPANATAYARALAQTESSAQKLNNAAAALGNAGGSLGKVGQGAAQLNSNLSQGAQLFAGLRGAAAGVGGALTLTEAVSSGIRLNAEYERIKTSLTVMLKDANLAEDLLGRLTQFAAETPFQTEQINSAATALLAFGESEKTVVTRLREIGDISAATGKDFNELAVIYGKARVAGVLYAEDINQLVEAGVPIIQEFAKQMGVSEAQVKKLASEGKVGFGELQKAFTNLTGAGGRFEGLMKAQSSTLAGIGSTVKDLFSQRLRETFVGLSEALKEAGRLTIQFFDTTKTGSQVLEEERIQLLATANQIRLTNVGTETRTKLINDLKAQYPAFLSQINAEKATNEQLQPILDKINQSYIIRIALQQEQEKLQPLLEAQAKQERELARTRSGFNTLLVKSAEIAGVNITQFKTEEEQVNAVTEALRKQAQFSQGSGQFAQRIAINEQARALEKLEAAADGIFIRTNAQKQATDKATQAEKERQGVIEQLKKTYGEIFDIALAQNAAPADAPAAAPGAPGGKKKTAAELEFERREKDIQRRRLLLNDLEDGLEKELETIRLHFDELRIEYEKAGLDTAKLTEKQSEAEISAAVEFFNALTEKETASIERQKKAGEAIIAARRDQLEKEKAGRDAAISLAEERGEQLVKTAQAAGAKEQEVEALQRQFQLATQKARLQSELEFQQALLAVIGAGNDAQAAEVRRAIALIQEQIKTITIEENAPTATEKKGGLLDFLGIELNDDEADAVQEAAGRIIESIRAITQARVEEAEAAVEAADKRVSAAEDALDRELELAQAGFASNVSLRRQELENAKEARRQAIQDQQRALRAQLVIDAATQASSLATSATQIMAAWSSVPFVGVVLAIAQIASMLAFITSVKARSRQIAAIARHGMDGFLDGDSIVRGRLHGHGGHMLEVESGELVQVGDDGGRRRVQVVRRERTSEYFDLLKAANKGSREEVAKAAMRVAGVASMPRHTRERLLNYYIATAGLSPMLAAPVLDRDAMRGRVLPPVNITVNTGGERTNAILEQILRVMSSGQGGDTYLSDGTRISGNVKTRKIG